MNFESRKSIVLKRSNCPYVDDDRERETTTFENLAGKSVLDVTFHFIMECREINIKRNQLLDDLTDLLSVL